MISYGRRSGKNITQKKWIADKIAEGKRPAIIGPKGLFCASCAQRWEQCQGDCYGTEDRKGSTGSNEITS